MKQDFSKKISIVISNEIPDWKAMNAVGHIAAYFGNKMDAVFDTGESFVAQDGVAIPRNSQYGIVVLQADQEGLNEWALEMRSVTDVQTMFFVKEMIDTGDDIELQQMLDVQDFKDIIFYGVGLFGGNEILRGYTNAFKLWS
ncbi:DUF2000 family protein [candidate division WWE3 bacterium]|nr:DUF2000 family protein [candidate division WWE3 bacterium]